MGFSQSCIREDILLFISEWEKLNFMDLLRSNRNFSGFIYNYIINIT